MTNTINQIIEIDALAQKKLAHAKAIKEQYLKELDEQTAQTNLELEIKTKNRIETFFHTEEKFAQEEMLRIKTETAEIINRIEKIYTDNHEKLEQEIFNNVISI